MLLFQGWSCNDFFLSWTVTKKSLKRFLYQSFSFKLAYQLHFRVALQTGTNFLNQTLFSLDKDSEIVWIKERIVNFVLVLFEEKGD